MDVYVKKYISVLVNSKPETKKSESTSNSIDFNFYDSVDP